MIKLFKKHPVICLLIIVGIIAVGLVIYFNTHEKLLGTYTTTAPEDVDKINYTYDDNEYKIINPDEMELINNYYSEIKNLMLNNPQELYSMLTNKNKTDKFNDSYDEFVEYIDTITTVKTKTNTISKYKIDESESSRTYTIIDSEGNKFTVKETGIWDITVSMDGRASLD